MAISYFCVIALLVCSSILSQGNEIKLQRFPNFAVQQKLLQELLTSSYDNRIPPHNPNSTASMTTLVTANMYVRAIDSLDDISQTFNTQLTFRTSWRDERLAYSHKPESNFFPYVTADQRVWVPDIFFTNEKKAYFHDVVLPNVYIRVYPDGQVLHSLRISLTLKCAMNFRYFPFDTQNCSVRFASYGKTLDNLVLTWQAQDPVKVATDINLPLFHLLNFTTTSCNSQTETGVYSCLNATFLFKRRWNYYLIHVYIPCSMCVILAWVTLFFPHEGTGGLGRIVVDALTLLAMSRQIAYFNTTLPPISYTKAIDVWTGICLTFVSAAIWEFAVVQYLARNRQKAVAITAAATTGNDEAPAQKSAPTSTLAERIDVITRIVYAIAFVAFCIIYVVAYCVRPY